MQGTLDRETRMQTPEGTKKWLFRGALVALPVLFFVLLEGGLRLFGYGANLALFEEVDWKGTPYYVVNPDVVRRYFSDPDFGTYTSVDRFLVRKPTGALRIFCLGASTTIGYPYFYNGAFSALIDDRLEARFPDRTVEVVNVGITAVNSFTVADLARDVMRYEPDLIVVYAGQNEFYGALGVGSTEYVGSRRWLVRTYLALQHLKTVQLLRDGLVRIAGLGDALGGTPEADERQLMEKMVRDREIRPGSPLREAAAQYFRENYEDALRTAQAHGVPVLAATLASNLRDQPPFVSVHAEELPADRQQAWAGLFARARAAADRGRCDEAIEDYRRALALDDTRADGHFHLARCLEAQGAYNAARAAYERARDLDALPFRAPSAFNETLRDLARTHDVPLVDVEAVFAQAASHGIPGDDLFWEHVHPRLDGYFLMARAFTDAMETNGLLVPPRAWRAAPERSDDFFRGWAGVTPLDHEVARLRIALLKNRWPFRMDPVELDYRPEGPMQEVAWDYLRGQTTWAAAHDRLARAYLEQDRPDLAADEFWAVAKMSPHDPHYALTTADLLARHQQFDRAADAYARALRSGAPPEVHTRAGVAFYQARRFDEAIPHLAQALDDAPATMPLPMRVQLHTFLCTAYLNTRRLDEAAAELERLRTLAPTAPQVPALQAALERFRRAAPTHE